MDLLKMQFDEIIGDNRISTSLLKLDSHIKSMDTSQRCKILKLNQGNGTVLQRLASRGNKEALEALLNGLPTDETVNILRITNAGGQTPLHFAAAAGHADTICCFIDHVGRDDRYQLLILQDVGGNTALHKAVEASHPDTIRCIMSSLTAAQKMDMLRMTNNRQIAVIDPRYECSRETQELIQWFHSECSSELVNHKQKRFPSTVKETTSTLVKSYTPKDWREGLEFLINKIRHSAPVEVHVLESFLESVKPSFRLSLLRAHNNLGTALHCAASRGSNDIVICLLNSLNPADVYSVVKVHKDDGATILHTCYNDGNTEIALKIHQLVSRRETIDLLGMRDTAKLTCMEYATQKNQRAFISSLLDAEGFMECAFPGRKIGESEAMRFLFADEDETCNQIDESNSQLSDREVDEIKLTYNKWRFSEPLPFSPGTLSQKGLRYSGMSDVVLCVYCQETYHLLHNDGKKLQEHLDSPPGYCSKRLGEQKAVVEENTPNLQMTSTGEVETMLDHNTMEMEKVAYDDQPGSLAAKTLKGVETSENAIHHFNDVDERIRSMSKLITQSLIPFDRKQLATNGNCYYTGLNDLVQCIRCKARFKVYSKSEYDRRMLALHTESSEDCKPPKEKEVIPEIVKDSLMIYYKEMQLEMKLAEVRRGDCVQIKRDEFIAYLMAVRSKSRLVTILMSSNDLGSVLHKLVAMNDNSDLVECITDSLDSSENMYRLLRIQDECGRTAIHVAAQNRNWKALSAMLDRLKAADRMSVLKMIDTGRLTPFHCAIRSNASTGEGVICKSIETLLPGDIAEDCLEEFLIGSKCQSDSFSSANVKTIRAHLDSLRSSHDGELTNFEELILHNENNGLAKLIRMNEERELLLAPALKLPLTSEQLDVLSPIAQQYIIPHNQGRCKKQALIYYCDRDRVGADEEAERMEQALAQVGFNTMKETWESFWGFRKALRDKVEAIGKETSVLFVVVMSHGIRGHIHGDDNDCGSINTIMYEMRCGLPPHIPMILLVQACQTSQHLPDDDQTDHRAAYCKTSRNEMRECLSKASETEHIILRRPHTALLLSTVPGGRAIRGLYTSAIADQLERIADKVDLRSLHMAAVRSIKSQLDYSAYEQIPEYRDTFDRSLFITRQTD